MRNCLIYGNCQIEPLREILEKNSSFANKYRFLQLQPVHLLTQSDIDDLESKITKTDLFIHQLVSDNYQGIKQLGTNYLSSRLPPTSRKIAITGAYFTGYHPGIINLKDGEGNKIDEPCDYHDVNLLYLFNRGKTVSETVNLIQEKDFYHPDYVVKNLEITFNELRRREQDLDICLTDFILKNYRHQQLFHTINHPNITILNYLAESILNLLKIPCDNQPQHLTENLDFTDFPIYPSVAQALKLNFKAKPQYRIKGETLTLKQTVDLFFDFYQENRELVKLNIIQHQEKYAVTVCGIQVKSTQIFKAQILNRSRNNSHDDSDLLNCVRQQTFQDLLDLAEQHCHNDLYQEAIALNQAALKIDSQSIQGWRQLAHCYEAQGDLKAAITASDRAVMIDPEQADSTIHQARLLELQGKTPMAKELYQQAIAIDDAQPPWVYRHLGNVLMAEDNPTEAIIAYEKAIALNPDFGAQIYLSLAEAYEQQQQWKQAKNAYNQALKINPDLQEQIRQRLQNIVADS